MKRILLLTANVGSLFEEEARLQSSWLKVMTNRLLSERAEFVVIHMQETGGKHFEECSWQVPKLVEELFEGVRHEYPACRAMLDIDFEHELYTALGSIFFARKTSLDRIAQYNFKHGRYEKLNNGLEIIAKDLDISPFVIKQKFPKHFWPAIKWGRKGFMHARFRCGNHYFDLVNVHLFHDESNLALIHENPHLYSSNRKRALEFVLEHLEDMENGHPAYVFIFGDLNFRLNCTSFLTKLTEQTETHPIDEPCAHGSIGDHLAAPPVAHCASGANIEHHLNVDPLRRTVSAIEFRRDVCEEDEEQNSCVLRIEKKRFDYFNHKKLLLDWRSYLEDDCEAKAFPDLHEVPIDFPPTYPWSEDPTESEVLMKTRAPAWCDRVLMNQRAWKQVNLGTPAYASFGRETCMGDHKPVYLAFGIND